MKLSIINEMFDKILSYEWTNQIATAWEAQFELTTKLGKTEIQLYIHKVIENERGGNLYGGDDDEIDDQLYDVWEVSFLANVIGETYGSFGILNSGSASIILGTVMAAINEFINIKKPEYLVFTANGESRINLYKAMMNKFLPSGWSYKTVSTTYLQGGDQMFVATRGSLDASDEAIDGILNRYME